METKTRSKAQTRRRKRNRSTDRFLGDLRDRWGGLGLATVARNLMRTLEYQTAYYDCTVDPAVPNADLSTRRIYVFWHEYIPYQFYLRGNCDVVMLLSRNRDAEWLSRAARHMGFGTVRGSTFRGARAALHQLMKEGRNLHLTMTPDGPRGPRRRLSVGPIFLASKLRIPIVAVGMGYDRPWRMPTWDRFALPRPFSRARAVWSPPLHVPTKLDRDVIERHRLQVERILNQMTFEAEQWAESDKRVTNQVATRRQAAIRRTARYSQARTISPLRSWS